MLGFGEWLKLKNSKDSFNYKTKYKFKLGLPKLNFKVGGEMMDSKIKFETETITFAEALKRMKSVHKSE